LFNFLGKKRKEKGKEGGGTKKEGRDSLESVKLIKDYYSFIPILLLKATKEEKREGEDSGKKRKGGESKMSIR